MRATDTFRSQHAEIVEIVEAISALLTEEKLATQSREVSRLMARFSGKLKGHLLMEDKVLYPKLMAHSDPGVNNLANRYMKEMGGIAEAVGEYSERWKSAELIEADVKAFIVETKRLFAVLAKRIKSEDEVLYPALDAVS
ncbi:MAG: hemerythrin domain-containing protein [bacterium]